MTEELETLGPVDEGDSKNLVDLFVFSLLRSRYIIALCGSAGLVLGLANGVLRPNTYESVGKLLVRPGIRESASADSALTGRTALVPRAQDAIQDEIHILSNPAVLRRAAEEVGPKEILRPYDPAAEDDAHTPWHMRLLHTVQSWWFHGGAAAPSLNGDDDDAYLAAAARRLGDGIGLQVERGSGIISVDYEAHSPELARDVVQVFLEACVRHHREVFATDPSLQYLEDETSKARDETARIMRTIMEFRIEYGIFDFRIQRSDLVAYLEGLRHKVHESEVELTSLDAQREFLEKMLDELPATRDVIRPTASLANPEFNALSSHLRSLQLSRFNLLAQRPFTEQSVFEERLRDLDRIIEDTEEKLREQTPYIDSRVAKETEENPRFTRLQQDLDRTKQRIATLEVTRAEHDTLCKRTKGELEELERRGLDLAALEDAARHYRTTAEGLGETSARLRQIKGFDEMEFSNLRIVQDASYPVNKVGPRRMRAIMFGILFGLFVGMSFAVCRSMFDSRVRRPVDGVNALGAPCHAVVDEARAVEKDHGADWAEPATERLCRRFRAAVDSLWVAIAPRGAVAPFQAAVISARSGAGNSTLSACAAIGLARNLMEPVTLVECDNQNPVLARLFDVSETPGLYDVIAGRAQLDDARHETGIPGLRVLPAGSGFGERFPGRFATPAFGEIIRQLRTDQEFAIYDGPPILEDSDGRLLLANLDGAVLVLESGHTSKVDAVEMARILRDSGADLLGFYLNRYRPVSRHRSSARRRTV